MTLAPRCLLGERCVYPPTSETQPVMRALDHCFSFDIGYSNIIHRTAFAEHTMRLLDQNKFRSTHVICFIDSLQTGRGDFDGSPIPVWDMNFCFELTPLSNDPALTNIRCWFYRMDTERHFNGTVASGCCPSFSPGCHLGSGGAVGACQWICFGADDPGNTTANYGGCVRCDTPTRQSTFNGLQHQKWTMIF